MSSYTTHNDDDSVSVIPSTIPVELQLWDNTHREHTNPNSHPHTFAQPNSKEESGNATDANADAGREGGGEEGINGISDTEGDVEMDDPERVYQQLLPADGGPAAWRLLIAAFVFEAILWGLFFFYPP